MGSKTRLVKTSIGYWLIDTTDSFNFFPKEWIENFEDLLIYRKNHQDEDWEFADNFPEREIEKLKGVTLPKKKPRLVKERKIS